MASDVGFGILGSGNMGRVYGDALTTFTRGGRLAAIAMGTRADALAAEYGVDAEQSADALLDRSDIDVGVIATPHTTHLDLARRTAAAGNSSSRWRSTSRNAIRSSRPAGAPACS
jgi:predicted dehydrogenase